MIHQYPTFVYVIIYVKLYNKYDCVVHCEMYAFFFSINNCYNVSYKKYA
jgi:hypothetical protein